MLQIDKETLKPWRVVIIDDSPDDCAEIRRMLLIGSDRRITFVEAKTAAVGIRTVLDAVPPPDCVVLDYYLPDMDAPEVLAGLSGPDGMPVCPVVVVTGIARRDEGRRVLRAGAQDYIGKDWTSAPALTRAVENSAESWAMARELRQRKDALRLVTDRETFRSVFSDATRGVTDEHALIRVATHMLGVHLQVNRVAYCEVIKQDNVVVGKGYVNGVVHIDGTYRLSDYGPKLLALFQSGQYQIVNDMPSDTSYTEVEKAGYAQLEIVADLAIPILKNGQLVAIFGLHQKVSRYWTPGDMTIAREVAERTWASVEHVRAERKLHATELQLSQMLEIMPSFSVVLAGPSHIFQLANQAYLDLIKRGPEIIGKTFVEALPELADQPFPALLDEVYRTGQPFEAKAMMAKLRLGPDEVLTDMFFDFSYLPLRDINGEVSGIFMHGVDRTVETRASRVLARREREIRSVTENTPDVLTRFDSHFRHVFVNSVIEKVTGRPVSEILGKTSRELDMPSQLCDEWEKAIRFVFDHGLHRSLDFSWPTPDGLRHFSCHLVPEFDEHGQVETTLGVTHDITNRRAYEQRLLEQDIRKDEFLATLAHELRNPLAPIRTGFQLLKLAPSADVAARTLPVLERQLGQLVCLIDDLLDVSRISSGKIVLKRERTAFQDVAAAALEASRPLIDAAHHGLTTDWPADAVWLDADPTRLTQIFSNLLTNSAKYMHPGGQISFSARQQGASIVVAVKDSGMGIPADMLGQVFDMFTQVNRTLERSQGGLGIGLSLVKTLVEMHGGSVEAVSGGIDLGSTFTVTLPTAPTLALEPPIQPVQLAFTASVEPRRPARQKILVVDDNIDAAETMVMLLELSGHDTRTAFGGQQALDVASAFCPDVVFLDIGLPGMNGYEVARHLLTNPATASAKLIALTGWGTEEDIRKSKAAGFHAHLTKPVDPNAVDAILATLLPA
jgi:PAS domain S-box-containing protein